MTSGETTTDQRFTVFAYLWAMAILFHMWNQVAFVSTVDAVYVATAVAALGVVLRPSSPMAFLVLSGMVVVQGGRTMPNLANHELLSLLVGLTVLISAARIRLQHPNKAMGRGELFTHFVPTVRIIFLISYAFAAVAKYNRDFLDPEVSCAAEFYRRTMEIIPGMPVPNWMQWVVIFATILAETAVVPCLIFPKLRVFGLMLGSMFHALLPLSPVTLVSDFSAMLFAMFFLFAPPDFTDRVRAVVTERRLFASMRMGTVIRWIALIPFAVLAGISVWGQGRVPNLYASDDPWSYYYGVLFLTFVVYGAGWITMLLIGFLSDRREVPKESGIFQLKTIHGGVLIVLALFNGLCPYLGMKTKASFTMFSNLGTENGVSNHLFIPPLYLAGFQNDLVEPLSSFDPLLQRYLQDGKLITWFELVNLTNRNRMMSLRYIHRGREFNVKRAKDVPELVKPPPWWQRKLLDFRPVDKDGRARCDH